MALIAWDDSLTVNVREIDSQHKMLLTLVNQLHEATKFGRGSDILGEVFSEVVEYTKYHFAAEERLMRENGFPEYLLHKALHEDLRVRLTELQREFDGGERAAVGIGTIQFLRDWLVNHISARDRAIGQYMANQGVLGPRRARIAS
jgi:hemerythrin